MRSRFSGQPLPSPSDPVPTTTCGSPPRRTAHCTPPENLIDAKLANLAQLSDDERAIVLGVIDAVTTKAKLRLITSGAS